MVFIQNVLFDLKLLPLQILLITINHAVFKIFRLILRHILTIICIRAILLYSFKDYDYIQYEVKLCDIFLTKISSTYQYKYAINYPYSIEI